MYRLSASLLAAVLLLGACRPPSGEQAPPVRGEVEANPPGAPLLDGPIQVLPDGLRYIDDPTGASTGITPIPGDLVGVFYTAWLTDGTQLPGPGQAEEPITFTLGSGQVIRGLEEGVASMQVGGKRRLIIPPELAYGDSPNGAIPAHATLIFDVELVSLQRIQLPNQTPESAPAGEDLAPGAAPPTTEPAPAAE